MKPGQFRAKVLKELSGETCPRCGSDRIALILWGLISHIDREMQSLMDEGLIELRGCCAREENCVCRKCKHEFPYRKTREWIQKHLTAPPIADPESVPAAKKRKKPKVPDPEAHLPMRDKTLPCDICLERVPLKRTDWIDEYGTVCIKCQHQLRQMGDLR